MARFEYTKTVEHYSFNPPRFISQEDYNIMKMKLQMNPHAPLINETDALKGSDRMNIIVLVGFIALAIGLIGMFSNDNPPGWAVILVLISVFGVLHPLVNMGAWESSRNRARAEEMRIQYFRKVKALINTTSDYSAFRNRYAEMFNR